MAEGVSLEGTVDMSPLGVGAEICLDITSTTTI